MSSKRDRELHDLIVRVLEAHLSCPAPDLIRDMVDIAKSERHTDAHPEEPQDGVALISAERQRQIDREGWTPAHDDAHALGELVTAAMCYAIDASHRSRGQATPDAVITSRWPWEREWWKPSPDPIRNLVKAGALLAAEIDRLQRAALPDAGGRVAQTENHEDVTSRVAPLTAGVDGQELPQSRNEEQ